MIMLRNPEIETKRRDASKDIDPESEIRGDDDLSVKDEVEERREMEEHGDDTPDSRIHRRAPPSESEPDL